MSLKVRTRSTGLAGITNLSLLAPLRSDMVPGIEPMSYVGRLRKVLDALHASRRNLRESELLSVFPDVVGRFGVIHAFRYALVAPDAAPNGMPANFGTWRLSLNVTFDGGWEPYMRVIQRDIGPLLDLLFCHANTYPGSLASYEDYCDWVRAHEVPAGLFYADSPSTVEDSHYLAGLEALQRAGASDDALTRHHLTPSAQRSADALADAWKSPVRALALPLRTLKGLYRLATYFPPNADGDVLRRFAQDSLKGPIELMNQIEDATQASPLNEDTEQLKDFWNKTQAFLSNELDWLQWRRKAASPPAEDDIVDPAKLQAHVLGEGEDELMTHGCMVLLQVRTEDKASALRTIAGWEPRCRPVAPGDIGYLVAFTYPGLQALGVTPERLATLPQEFVEGMEARSAVLGDVRTNHPDRWTRPPLWEQPSGQRVDLYAVHVVVHLRLKDKTNKDERHPRLLAEVGQLGSAGNGLRVLAVEAMRSYRDEATTLAVGHMGIVDGVSQPKLPTQTASAFTHYNDKVRAGELLLGYANERGDKAPAFNALLHDGTFLAVRKLRQFMDRLDAATQQHGGQAFLATMVGRGADGAPLTGLPADAKHGNDFRFTEQSVSDACPFHSHVRRCNPRDGRAYTPRILRRGMSWGTNSAQERKQPRGVMFMAYCASLAEQFEVIQRWVAGGNASGVGSAQGDPLLRVPKEGETYTFRHMVGNKPQRVEFDDKPLVQLEWGIYAFVPSRQALKDLETFTRAGEAAPPPDKAPGLSELEAMRALLEDRDKSEDVWQWVREGRDEWVPRTSAYGTLVGQLDDVMAILCDRDNQFSVRGYGERMGDTIGLNLLGMDRHEERRRKELPVNEVIAAITEDQAFQDALPLAQDILSKFPKLPSADGDIVRQPVDLVDFSNRVLAGLCHLWFGLPDGQLMVMGGYRAGQAVSVPRCPGSFGPASRYMFMPHPQEKLAEDGRAHARAVRKAVHDWLDGLPPLQGHRLSLAIDAALATTGSQQHLADNIAGTMLGLAPSVQSNFLRVMEIWIDAVDRDFWVLQQKLFEQSPGQDVDHAQATSALRASLMATLRKHPVPTMAWRSPVVGGRPDTDPGKRVVLGLQSALANPNAPDVLVFGRDHEDYSKNKTVHGCPGYTLAMGVMLAMIASLMKAGTLRPTGSPVLLILTPR